MTAPKKDTPSHDFFGFVISKLKTYLFTGILVTTPVTITFYMAYELLIWLDKWTRSLIPPQMMSEQLFYYIPGFGVIVLISALIIIGVFTTGFIGGFFVRLGNYIVSKIPLISSIHSLLKQLFETVLSPKSQSFKEAVLVQYPRKGIWIIGFLAGSSAKELQDKTPIDEELLSIFIPTTPNPTSGFLILMPKSEVIKLDMSVEDALKYVVSCGIVAPNEKVKKIK